MPRSTSWVAIDGSAAARPVCSSILTAAVRTSARAGDAGSSDASAMRGRPRRSSPSRTTAAIAPRACGDTDANRLAPAPPYAPPSVETNTSVRFGKCLRRRLLWREAARELDQSGGAGGVLALEPARCRRCHDGRQARLPRSSVPGRPRRRCGARPGRARRGPRSRRPPRRRSPATRSSRGTSAQRPPPRRSPGRAPGTRS